MELKQALSRGPNADECGWALAQYDNLTANGEPVRLSPMVVLSALQKTSPHPWDSYTARWSIADATEVLRAYKHYMELNDDER
jgi:hypothetical protein